MSSKQDISLIGEVIKNGNSFYILLDKEFVQSAQVEKGDKLIYAIKDVVPGFRRQLEELQIQTTGTTDTAPKRIRRSRNERGRIRTSDTLQDGSRVLVAVMRSEGMVPFITLEELPPM